MEDSKRSQARRGFAGGALTKERHIEVATAGARTLHTRGKAHRFSSQEAKVAGRKGGLARWRAAKEAVVDDIVRSVSDTEPAPPPVHEEEGEEDE